jgi:hypothetical protein
MSWISRIRCDAENQLRWGDWIDAVALMEPRIEADGMARLNGEAIRSELNVSKRMARKRDKKVTAFLNSIGWRRHELWVDGRKRNVWIKPTTPNAAIREPGRPKGSKDAKPRQRRWHRRPEGVPVDDWRRLRKERGLPA